MAHIFTRTIKTNTCYVGSSKNTQVVRHFSAHTKNIRQQIPKHNNKKLRIKCIFPSINDKLIINIVKTLNY